MERSIKLTKDIMSKHFYQVLKSYLKPFLKMGCWIGEEKRLFVQIGMVPFIVLTEREKTLETLSEIP